MLLRHYFLHLLCSAAHRDPKLLFQRTDIFENTFYLQNKCIDWHSHVFIFYVMCTGSIKALFKVTFRPENWHPEFMKTSEGIKWESVCPLCLVILTTQSWPPLCLREKFLQKYEYPEKFVMLLIVNAIDFTSKHVVYGKRCHRELCNYWWCQWRNAARRQGQVWLRNWFRPDLA